MTEVPVAARIWRRTRTKVAQSQTLLRTTRQLLEAIIASTRLGFVAAEMRRRIDAVMPYGEVFLRTVDQLIGNFRHRKLLAVVAGVAGLVLILILLLEISALGSSFPKRRLSTPPLLRRQASRKWMLGTCSLFSPQTPAGCNLPTRKPQPGLYRSWAPKRSDKSFRSRYLRALVPPAERDT